MPLYRKKISLLFRSHVRKKFENIISYCAALFALSELVLFTPSSFRQTLAKLTGRLYSALAQILQFLLLTIKCYVCLISYNPNHVNSRTFAFSCMTALAHYSYYDNITYE